LRSPRTERPMQRPSGDTAGSSRRSFAIS
jgi:hypothetical protein